ncbi:MAG: proline dehydrogenase family protein [Trueperaceae bacterium]
MMPLMDFPALYRNVMLTTADAPFVRKVLTRYGWRLGVGRFVAGKDLEDALPALRKIEESGRSIVLDVLGEFVTSEAEARATAERIGAAVKAAAAAGTSRYFSVKPTQLGLGVSSELAYELASGLAATLFDVGGDLCLDMENVPYLDRTLDLYERLRRDGHHHVSTVLQSYLHRTPGDLERIIALAAEEDQGPTEVRMVKGAYREKPEVAYQDRPRIEEAYRELSYRALEAGVKLNLGTHDEALLRELLAYVRGSGANPEKYEVQMLYGVRNGLQEQLAAAGHPMRVYVPFGDDWYGYYSRRIAERPSNLAFVLRGLVG